jgi:hypothetical protein
VRALRLTTLALLALAASLPGTAAGQVGVPEPTPEEPAPPLEVQAPAKRVLVKEGQDGRLLLGGRWYFRPDDTFVGEQEGWFRQRDLAGWTPVRVPNSWNASDTELDKASVGWYRKELRLPKAPKGVERSWKVRFEGVNYRATAWLNGRRIGSFVGYFPFELDLPDVRPGRNTLVVKVSSLRSRTDLTHWRPAAFNGYGVGGWWNFGGILREVYVRAIDTVDVERVEAVPRLRCLKCDARVAVRTTVRNMTRKKRKVGLAVLVRGPGGFEQRVRLKRQTVAAGARAELGSRVDIERPRLWQPGRPALYSMAVTALTGKDERPVGTYRLSFGVRKLERRRGLLFLNGRQVHLRGASIHEDDPDTGAALTPADRGLLLSRLRDLGATVTRSHYPLHPAFLEALDRAGILYWSQVPVYQPPNSFFDLPAFRESAERAVRLTVQNNLNHPSVFAWSLANEPAGSRPERGVIGRGLRTYICDAAAAARELDDTRLIAIDRQSRIGETLWSPSYRCLDALGVNEYFGWYESVRADMPRGPSTTEELGPYLDDMRRANPGLVLIVTEYGAEGSRKGPAAQRGTYDFQTRYALAHLRIHNSKRWLAGSIAWALRDFRVEPSWQGGAPLAYATPPWNNKSLIEETNARKPVYFELRQRWRRTRPLG